MTDMVIPPAREAVVAAIRYELDAIEARDYYGQVLPQEDSEVIAAAVLALLPTGADTKALVETATRLGRELGRREAAEEIAEELGQRRELHWVDRALTARIAREIATKEPIREPEAHRTRCSHCGFYRPSLLNHHPECPHAATKEPK